MWYFVGRLRRILWGSGPPRSFSARRVALGRRPLHRIRRSVRCDDTRADGRLLGSCAARTPGSVCGWACVSLCDCVTACECVCLCVCTVCVCVPVSVCAVCVCACVCVSPVPACALLCAPPLRAQRERSAHANERAAEKRACAFRGGPAAPDPNPVPHAPPEDAPELGRSPDGRWELWIILPEKMRRPARKAARDVTGVSGARIRLGGGRSFMRGLDHSPV